MKAWKIARTCGTSLVAGALLTGCANAPVGYFGKDEVLFSNADTIKIQWDNNFTTEEAVRAKAAAHCGGRPMEVIDASATYGVFLSKTWRCVGAAGR